MEFEWDEKKAASNLQKHGVSFAEAATAFEDNVALTAHDPRHSIEEDRYWTMGMSGKHRLLIISHTDRQGAIRIISARVASRRERKDYQDGNFP